MPSAHHSDTKAWDPCPSTTGHRCPLHHCARGEGAWPPAADTYPQHYDEPEWDGLSGAEIRPAAPAPAVSDDTKQAWWNMPFLSNFESRPAPRPAPPPGQGWARQSNVQGRGAGPSLRCSSPVKRLPSDEGRGTAHALTMFLVSDGFA